MVNKILKFIRAAWNTLWGRKFPHDRLAILKTAPSAAVLPWREGAEGIMVYLLGHQHPVTDNQERTALKVIGGYIGAGETAQQAAKRVLENKAGIKIQISELIWANQAENYSAIESPVKIFQLKMSAAPDQLGVPSGAVLVELPLRKALGLAREGRLRDFTTTTVLWQLAYDQGSI